MSEESGRWRAIWLCEKRYGSWTCGEIDAGVAPPPYETVEVAENILMTAGVKLMFQALRGDAVTLFNNANARMGVGDGSSAAAPGQTDLQGASKTRAAMDAGYPKVSTTDGLDLDNKIQFRSTFDGVSGNHWWLEWGIFNAGSGGVMLNRKAENLGQKSAGSTWTLTGTITIA